MTTQQDGMTIARQRIAEEAAQRTGWLDLIGLGLTALPDELFALTHLPRLYLGPMLGSDDPISEGWDAPPKPNCRNLRRDYGLNGTNRTFCRRNRCRRSVAAVGPDRAANAQLLSM